MFTSKEFLYVLNKFWILSLRKKWKKLNNESVSCVNNYKYSITQTYSIINSRNNIKLCCCSLSFLDGQMFATVLEDAITSIRILGKDNLRAFGKSILFSRYVKSVINIIFILHYRRLQYGFTDMLQVQLDWIDCACEGSTRRWSGRNQFQWKQNT